MHARLPVAVLVSGRGSNLQALMQAREAGRLAVDFTLVGSDKAEAPALRLAEARNIPTLALDPSGYPTRRDYDRQLLARIQASGAQYLVLAGFMRVLDGEAIAPWQGRILNIHPSLLPKHRGLHTHRKVLAAGDREHGASVHYVTAELDGGPVIAQARIAVQAGDDEDALATRLLPFEHRLLPAVLELVAAGRMHLRDGQACLDGQALAAPLQWVGEALQRG